MTASMTTVAAVSVAGAIATAPVATNVRAKAWIIQSRQFRRHGPVFHQVRSCVKPDSDAEHTNYAEADQVVDRDASSQEHAPPFSRVYKLR